MPKPPSVETTEVVADPANDRRQRRRFSGEYRRRVLAEAAACRGRGEVGALLRKVVLDLFSSFPVAWMIAERENSALSKQLLAEASRATAWSLAASPSTTIVARR